MANLHFSEMQQTPLQHSEGSREYTSRLLLVLSGTCSPKKLGNYGTKRNKTTIRVSYQTMKKSIQYDWILVVFTGSNEGCTTDNWQHISVFWLRWRMGWRTLRWSSTPCVAWQEKFHEVSRFHNMSQDVPRCPKMSQVHCTFCHHEELTWTNGSARHVRHVSFARINGHSFHWTL